jgi:hypothetical protein
LGHQAQDGAQESQEDGTGPLDQPFQGDNTRIYLKNLNLSAGQQ